VASDDQEPIAQYVALQLQRARQRWQQSGLHPGAKRLIVVFAILALLVTVQIWLPAGVWLLGAYGGYRLVRFIYRLCFCSVPVARPAAAVPTAARAPRPLAATAAAPAFIIKPLAVRMTELIGSMLAAAAVTAAMCVAMYVLETYHDMPMHIEQCAWLYLVSLAGAWIVLAVSKFWEGSRGERLLRHFILMTIGFGLGLAAFGAAEFFGVHLPADHTLTSGVNHAAPHWVPPAFYHDGRPTAMAYMAVFATLLGLLRWWLDADPMRNTRLSIWSLVVTVVIACCIAGAWHFPEPWLMMVAACMSVSVQLASPWVPLYARLHPQRKKVI
jgi:hypothetical protein